MKTFDQFLVEKREITIHTLASYIRQFIHEQSPLVLQENQEKLLATFKRAGEYAYGMYSHILFQSLQMQLKETGFMTEPEFPGHFASASIEYWGPPEERERCLWCVVRTAEGMTLGTLVTRVFHDHTQFRIPHAPGIITLEETETPAIIEALSHASIRLSGIAQEDVAPEFPVTVLERPAWQYSVEVGLADCIDSHKIEICEGMLDHALALWGHYGWELVSAIPHQGRLIAIFKRPARCNIQCPEHKEEHLQ